MNQLLHKGVLKVKSKYRHLQRETFSQLGFYNNKLREARGAKIIIYHGVCREHHTRFNNIFLTLKTFEAHLKLYKKYFNVLSLSDFYEQRFSNDRYNICLSFDDGFANNYDYVLPLLEHYQLPATFFITAIREAGYDILWNDFLGIVSYYGPEQIEYNNECFRKNKWNKYISQSSGASLQDILRLDGFGAKQDMMQQLNGQVPFRENKSLDAYWLQMTQEQICRLSQSKLATIGAHSHYHNDLSKIPLSDASTEMALSKKYLEGMIQKDVRAFAFPYGTYTREVVAAAKEVGYEQLLAMDFFYPEDITDPIMRERFTVNPFISAPNQMYANVTGKY